VVGIGGIGRKSSKFHRVQEERRGAGRPRARHHRKFVEAHGGWIRAGNRKKGGSRFSFALPLGDIPPPFRTAEEDASA
jgi:K+-sensing histidine kinase KdpD